METKDEPIRKKRPPNGFFIFCNSHRAIVSKHNSKLENREVTKILASWWSMLGKEQAPFIKISEMRKRYHFKRYPCYKWFNPSKPIAPGTVPCTRLSSRKGNAETSTFSPGKLADVNEMGGLTDLMGDSSKGADPRPELPKRPADVDENFNQRPPGSAIKRKVSRPRKNVGNEILSTQDVNDNDFWKALTLSCPVYKYEDYLKRKAEARTVKKPTTKRPRRRAIKPHAASSPNPNDGVSSEHPSPFASRIELLLSAAREIDEN